MAIHADDGLEAFLDKWRARWPEWRIAQIFVPDAQRAAVESWFALLQELTDAAWSGSEAAPGAAKLAWWQEELRGWRKGARRHPLGAVLQKSAAPWERLADGLPSLMSSRDAVLNGSDPAAPLPALAEFGTVVMQLEDALFATETRVAPAMTEVSVASIVLSLLAARKLFAEVGDERSVSAVAWHAALLAPSSAFGLSRPRRIHNALLRERSRKMLQQPVSAMPVSPWRTVWLAWRAARE